MPGRSIFAPLQINFIDPESTVIDENFSRISVFPKKGSITSLFIKTPIR